jgi:hypothetical protein
MGFKALNNTINYDSEVEYDNMLKSQLSIYFPDINFYDLKKSTEHTDDGHIHYIDINTNIIYSYNIFSSRWIKKLEKKQKMSANPTFIKKSNKITNKI